MLQLLEEGVTVGEQSLVLRFEATRPEERIPSRDPNHVGRIACDQDYIGKMGLAHELCHLLQCTVHHHNSDRLSEFGVQLLIVITEGTDLLDDLVDGTHGVVVRQVSQGRTHQTIRATNDAFSPNWCGWRCGTT
jgi:hypothetical protein